MCASRFDRHEAQTFRESHGQLIEPAERFSRAIERTH